MRVEFSCINRGALYSEKSGHSISEMLFFGFPLDELCHPHLLVSRLYSRRNFDISSGRLVSMLNSKRDPGLSEK